MDQRSKFISALHCNDASFTAICEVFGISRETGYKWKRRWKGERSVSESRVVLSDTPHLSHRDDLDHSAPHRRIAGAARTIAPV